MDETFLRIPLGDCRYPPLLAAIKDPPAALYALGNPALLELRAVAVVGSRKASEYGRWTASTLGGLLAGQGVAVVSGLAAGIDAEAHRGALEAGGPTIAVMGCGIDLCYPAANRSLWKQIQKQGLVLSEYPPGTNAAPYTFPRRNRIISGLCEATVVAGAGLHSGALITAELAADQGRWVYAVPGNINSLFQAGSNQLLREGAIPLTVLADLLEDMGLARCFRAEELPALSAEESRLLQHLAEQGESTVENLCRLLSRTPPQVNGLLSVLEIKGLLRTSLGKVFLAK
jgi:DNA processing protein